MKMRAKSPVLPFFLTCGALLCVLALVNWKRGSRAPSREHLEEATRNQPNGTVLVATDTLHQRAWARGKLTETPKRATLWIVGSSTMGRFEGSMGRGEELVNVWLGNFTVSDLDVVAHRLADDSSSTRHVIVGVDLWWTANASWKAEAYREWMDDVAAAGETNGRIMIGEHLMAKFAVFKEQLSFERSHDTFLRILRGTADARSVRFAPEAGVCAAVAPSELYLRASDGHYISCESKSEAAIEKIAREYIATNTHQMAEWREIDTSRLARIERAVARLTKKGARVTLVGLPYHPLAYAALRADPTIGPLLAATDARLEALAKVTGATYLNLRDGAALGCAGPDFDDSHHPARSCMIRVATRINALPAPQR